jgi:hypothetical protein
MLGGSSICWEMPYSILMSFSIDWLHVTKAVSTDPMHTVVFIAYIQYKLLIFDL